jgi:anti-sigma factor RsiW
MSQAMSCSNIAWKVGPFIDGELPPSEREEVASHLATCTECVAMVVEFRRLDALAAGAGTVPSVSGDEWARLWEKVQAGAGSADAGRVVSFPASRGLACTLSGSGGSPARRRLPGPEPVGSAAGLRRRAG